VGSHWGMGRQSVASNITAADRKISQRLNRHTDFWRITSLMVRLHFVPILRGGFGSTNARSKIETLRRVFPDVAGLLRRSC
jgi:hypothetical protein